MICNGILVHDIVFDISKNASNHEYDFQGDNDNLYRLIRLKYKIDLKQMFKMTTYH